MNENRAIQFISTSVDDIRSSLKLMNPKTSFEIREDVDFLNRCLDFEIKMRNRASVIKMLRAKINKLKNLKPGVK